MSFGSPVPSLKVACNPHNRSTGIPFIVMHSFSLASFSSDAGGAGRERDPFSLSQAGAAAGRLERMDRAWVVGRRAEQRAHEKEPQGTERSKQLVKV